MEDIIMIVGEPVDSTVASYLGKLGCKVLVLERDKFPMFTSVNWIYPLRNSGELSIK